MSSHHIVREKQEPALLVLGLDRFDDEQLGQLLEWSPTVITCPLIAEQLHSLGIKIDWVVTDDAVNELQSDIQLLPLNGSTTVEAALKYLIAQGYPAVNIVTDDFELPDYLTYAGQLNLVIFHQHEKIYGVTQSFSKWKPAGDKIRFLITPKNLRTTGLNQTDHLTYVTNADGFFTLNFDDHWLFIAEQL